MDKLTDFLDEVRVRLRNPFFASFVFSWLIWNWKIWLGLFWLNPQDIKDLKNESVTNYVTYVKHLLNMESGFYFPILSALSIIIVLPFIRNLIEMYQAWSLNWGEKEVMRISGTGVISIEKYIEKKNQLNNQLEAFKQLAINESKLIDENVRLDSELIQTENELRKSQREFDKLRNDIGNSQSTETLNGIWTVRPGFNGNKEMRISISGNDLYEVLEVNKVDKYGRFLFCQNFQERLTICFISNSKTMNFVTLSSSNQNYMSGSWNDNIPIEFEKIR